MIRRVIRRSPGVAERQWDDPPVEGVGQVFDVDRLDTGDDQFLAIGDGADHLDLSVHHFLEPAEIAR